MEDMAPSQANRPTQSQALDDGALLIAQSGPFDGQRWTIHTTLLIGRDSDCDIIIPERQVSRHHAIIEWIDNSYRLKDLNSKNGTHHNGNQVISAVTLNDGDVIQIALVQQFRFYASDATIALDGDLTGPIVEAQNSKPEAQVLHVEKRSRRVFIGSQEILPPLSVAQFNLLEMLFDRQGQVIPRTQLITAIYGNDAAQQISDQALDALVRRLRDRLAEINPHHTYILTVRGHGLRLDLGR